jgi:hypothetical protein
MNDIFRIGGATPKYVIHASTYNRIVDEYIAEGVPRADAYKMALDTYLILAKSFQESN